MDGWGINVLRNGNYRVGGDITGTPTPSGLVAYFYNV
jgi:hypothetical protein